MLRGVILRLLLAVLLLILLPQSRVLGEEKTITMATTDWPPYYSEGLPGGGHVTEITREAFERMGYELRVSWMPWKRAQLQVEKGKYMGLLGAYKTPEREMYALYNKDPISVALSGVFTIEGNKIEADTLQDLEPYTIALLRGTSVSPEFDRANLKKRFTNTEEVVVKNLLAGRADVIAGDYFVFRNILNEIKSNKALKTVKILSHENIYNAFSKRVLGYEIIVETFDRGLEIIKSDGTYDRILEKHGFSRTQW